jgi:hypothetical protein
LNGFILFPLCNIWFNRLIDICLFLFINTHYFGFRNVINKNKCYVTLIDWKSKQVVSSPSFLKEGVDIIIGMKCNIYVLLLIQWWTEFYIWLHLTWNNFHLTSFLKVPKCFITLKFQKHFVMLYNCIWNVMEFSMEFHRHFEHKETLHLSKVFSKWTIYFDSWIKLRFEVITYIFVLYMLKEWRNLAIQL